MIHEDISFLKIYESDLRDFSLKFRSSFRAKLIGLWRHIKDSSVFYSKS